MSAPFAQITQGPAATTNKNTNQQALVLDRQNNIVSSVGDNMTSQAHQTAMLVLNAQTALSAITAAQNLLSLNLPANMLNLIGRTLLISGAVIYTSPGTTTPTISFAIKLGGVTLATITTSGISATASTNLPIQFQFQISVVSVGAAGGVESHGFVNANLSANTPGAAVASFNDTNTAVSGAVNLTIANALTVTIAASSAVTSAQLRQATVEVVA